MAATGLEVFDKTLQTTNVWLDEIMEEIGPDRQVAWHVLGAVLMALRDRLPIEVAAHLGAQLPLLVRGRYYDQWHVAAQPAKLRTAEEFLDRVSRYLTGAGRTVDLQDATRAVLRTLSRHVERGQVEKVIGVLPAGIQALWAERATAAGSTERGGTAGRDRPKEEATMKVSERMTRQVHMAHPGDTLRDAARTMAEIDAGALPVSDEERLVGMLTDRDIAIRAVARGKGPDTKVQEVMTPEVKYCFEDEDIADVAHNMADIQVRRLPVVDRNKRLVGILSLGDLAVGAGTQPASEALAGISRHGGQHTQTG